MATKDFEQVVYENEEIKWVNIPDLCKSCGICIAKCPKECLSFDEEYPEYLGMPSVKCDLSKCIACRTCENFCPDCAIFVNKKR